MKLSDFFKKKKDPAIDGQEIHKDISSLRYNLRQSVFELQRNQIKNLILEELDSLRDQVNVEKILMDLGEKYIMRKDLDKVIINADFDNDPVLILRFSHSTPKERVEVDRLVPLLQYV